MQQYILHLLDMLSKIGADDDGGVTRLGFTPDAQQARSVFVQAMHDSGLQVRKDAFGNLFGRLEGSDPNAPVVGSGSHLDTVPRGGNYDGVLGSVTALGVLREIQQRQQQGLLPQLRHPLECIVFQIEESTRFACSTMGSKILCGADPAPLLQLQDAQHTTVAEALAQAEQREITPQYIRTSALPNGYFKNFIELHIDQGPTLEHHHTSLGVVTDIVGVRRANVTIQGVPIHAGGTPMNLRHDALVTAAHAVIAMRRITAGYEGRNSMVGTVGQLQVFPGAINVVPGRVQMRCELRSTDAGELRTAWEEFLASLNEAAAQEGTTVSVQLTETSEPIPMDGDVQTELRRAAEKHGFSWMPMASGGGHDCMNIAKITKAGMLFVKSRDGLSHHPDEFAADDDIAAGAQTLLDALVAMAT